MRDFLGCKGDLCSTIGLQLCSPMFGERCERYYPDKPIRTSVEVSVGAVSRERTDELYNCVLSKFVFSLLNLMVPGSKMNNYNNKKRKYENEVPILCVCMVGEEVRNKR